MSTVLLDRIRQRASDSLWRWAAFSERYWGTLPDRPDLGCFGTGYRTWGVQTNQKYLGAMAVLAAGEGGAASGGRTERLATDRFLRAFRFSLASHRTGDAVCTDGTKWGRTWNSVLGIERMLHGVERMDAVLTDEDRAALRRVLVDEADYRLSVPVAAGLWSRDGRNKPESNLWNGALCARAALYYPEHPHAGAWTECAHRHFLNGLSIPADATDETPMAGRPLSAWHVDANFFPNFGLDRHGYLNVGCMAICLSQIALLHYAFVRRNVPPPETLYHHARELWSTVRRMVFADGRLLCIGGDTRIRYSGGQDYLLPVLVLAADHWHDPHALHLLDGAVELMAREQFSNADGSFLSGRLSEMSRHSPCWFTRLESDKAVALSLVVHWLSWRTPGPERVHESFEASVSGGWAEPEHGAALHRCPTRIASWSWRAAEPPQGLCLPPGRSDMAEWRENLGGAVRVFGAEGPRAVNDFRLKTFHGGFVTAGAVSGATKAAMADGWQGAFPVRHVIAFAALPDGHTVVRLERVELPAQRVYLDGWEGVKLEMPNDFFNGRQRRYLSERDAFVLEVHEGPTREVPLRSSWVNVDDGLGLVGLDRNERWTILRRGVRIGGSVFGSVLCDTLCYGLTTEPFDRFGPGVLFENAVVILSSVTADETQTFAREEQAGWVLSGDEGCKAVEVLGRDGRHYLLVVNFSETPSVAELEAEGCWVDVCARHDANELRPLLLAPLDPVVLCQIAE